MPSRMIAIISIVERLILVIPMAQLDIHDASLYIGNGSVKAKGQYGIDSGEFSIGGTIHNAEIAPFTQNLSTPASGIVNGEFSVKGKK